MQTDDIRNKAMALAYIGTASDLDSAHDSVLHMQSSPPPPDLNPTLASNRIALLQLSTQLIGVELDRVLRLVHHHLTRAIEGGEL